MIHSNVSRRFVRFTYYFNQLTGDTGSGASLGPYISRISAIGPEVGYCFLWGKCRVP